MNIPLEIKTGFNNNFQRKMVPIPDQPLLLKWNDLIQRSLVRGRGRSIHMLTQFYVNEFTLKRKKKILINLAQIGAC